MKHHWTPEEDQIIKDNMEELTDREISVLIGKTRSAVRNRRRKMGIYRTDEANLRHVRNGCFKKNHEPWNKGRHDLRMSPATEFKKGNQPANTKWDGAITIRNDNRGVPQKFVRIAKSKWVYFHRYIWEMNYGPIPPKHVLRFRNGDCLDVRISNLELISMAENAIRNQNYDSDGHMAFYVAGRDKKLREAVKQVPELLDLKRSQIKLRRVINDTAGQT